MGFIIILSVCEHFGKHKIETRPETRAEKGGRKRVNRKERETNNDKREGNLTHSLNDMSLLLQ